MHMTPSDPVSVTDPGCRVYWGSHGCRLWRGHMQPHVCECGGKPYHGRWTRFYGEDRTLFNAVVWHVFGWYYHLKHKLDKRRAES